MAKSEPQNFPDLMVEEKVNRRIRKVGIRNLYQFVQFDVERILGEFSLYVSLAGTRGVHMSRFVSAMAMFKGINSKTLEDLGVRLCRAQESQASFIKIRSKIPIEDMIVPITLEQKLVVDQKIVRIFQFVIQNITTCPCSLELCKSAGSGVPHIQRGFVTVTLKVREFHPNYLMDKIKFVASQLVLPERFVKRPDEHQLAVRCEKNPVFVEDVIEIVHNALYGNGETDFTVVAEHEESIHQHNAVAVDSKIEPDIERPLT